MKSASILIADAEQEVRRLLSSSLAAEGFEIVAASSGQAALDLVNRSEPSLAIVGAMMPELTGFEVCKALKGNPATANIPIVMLTAKRTEADCILAFEVGVDDFVAMPFSPRELILRIKAILRKVGARPAKHTLIQAGAICLDHERHLVTVSGAKVGMTVIEFKLLVALLEAKGRVLTRDSLLAQIWGFESDIGGRTVDTHLRRLRDKLGAAAEQIQTVRGFGYRLDEA